MSVQIYTILLIISLIVFYYIYNDDNRKGK